MLIIKSENEFPISHQNAAGHTLRSDFFRLDEDEVEAIQSQSNPEYASFTLDGKGISPSLPLIFTPEFKSVIIVGKSSIMRNR